ncbi:MAG: four helix bundle protein [Candidatus Zixiibacteriota bacterium]
MIRSYKDLEIWKRGVELVTSIYMLTKGFPKSETYALVDQVQRAALSIPSNIAEGHSRQHTKEFRQSLYVALGSLAELETQLIIAGKLGYLEEEKLNQFLLEMDAISKMTRGLIKRLQIK